MDVDVDLAESDSDEEDGEDESADLVPMPSAGGGIQELREKLHARMAALRRGGNRSYGEAGSRDELLEERRRQRAEMRERRRKETKEKIRKEAEAKGKKGKDNQRNTAPTNKVRCL